MTIDKEIEFKLAGVCGLYCGNCSIYRAYKDNDIETLERIAERFNISVEQIRCQGCRIDSVGNWNEDCVIRKCARDRGIDFCFECDSYPCEMIDEFVKSAESHRVIVENFRRIKEVGWRVWILEQDEKWRCPRCKHKIGFYSKECSVCGTQLN